MSGLIEKFLAASAWRYTVRVSAVEVQVNNRHGGVRHRVSDARTGDFGPWHDGLPEVVRGLPTVNARTVEEMAARLRPHGPVDPMPVGQLVFSLMSDGSAVVSAVPEDGQHIPTKPITAGSPSWCWGFVYQRLYGRRYVGGPGAELPAEA